MPTSAAGINPAVTDPPSWARTGLAKTSVPRTPRLTRTATLVDRPGSFMRIMCRTSQTPPCLLCLDRREHHRSVLLHDPQLDAGSQLLQPSHRRQLLGGRGDVAVQRLLPPPGADPADVEQRELDAGLSQPEGREGRAHEDEDRLRIGQELANAFRAAGHV